MGCVKRVNTEISLYDALWPDTHNTFHAFVYGPDALIRVNSHLSEREQRQALALLDLVGIHRRPRIDPRLSDRRWMNRQDTWCISVDARANLAREDSPIHRKRIVQLAQAKGYWSIWMTIFRDDVKMLTELISAFPGTATVCFDADGRCQESIGRVAEVALQAENLL